MGNWRFFNDVMIEFGALNGAIENVEPFDDELGKLGLLDNRLFLNWLTRLGCIFQTNGP